MQNRNTFDFPAIMAGGSRVNSLGTSEPYDLDIQEVTYLHFHREFELGFCLDGEGTLFHDKTEQHFSAGDIQIIYPYVRHLHCRCGDEPCHWVWMCIDCEPLCEALGIINFSQLNEFIGRSSALGGLVREGEHPELYAKLSAFLRRHSTEGYPDLVHMAYDFYGIILTAADSVGKTERVASPGRIAAIEPALRRISEDIDSGESTSVEALGELCSMSSTGLRKAFVKIIGVSPKLYIKSCRIQRAKQLLKSGSMKMIDIAYSIGYRDISGFNRSFSELTGETPSEYRRRHIGR